MKWCCSKVVIIMIFWYCITLFLLLLNINIEMLNTCRLFDLKNSQDRHSMDDSLQSCHQIQAGWLEGSSKAPKRNYNGKETECCESRWKQTSRTNENKWKDFLKQSLHLEPVGHCTLVLTHHWTHFPKTWKNFCFFKLGWPIKKTRVFTAFGHWTLVHIGAKYGKPPRTMCHVFCILQHKLLCILYFTT